MNYTAAQIKKLKVRAEDTRQLEHDLRIVFHATRQDKTYIGVHRLVDIMREVYGDELKIIAGAMMDD